jgi:hypothetical protein
MWAAVACLSAFLIPSQQMKAQGGAISQSVSGMSLYINILEGENALDNIRDRTAREPIVQVVDENHKPVRGAMVTFTDVAGATGAAAAFGGLATYTTVTDADGKAVGRGLKPNNIDGDHRIEVSAVLGALVAEIVIHQKNVSEGVAGAPGNGVAAFFASAPKVAITGLAAAGAGIGLYLGLVQNNSPINTALTAVTPATPVTVPEIDPSMAYGCLIMLAGATAVLRGRG